MNAFFVIVSLFVLLFIIFLIIKGNQKGSVNKNVDTETALDEPRDYIAEANGLFKVGADGVSLRKLIENDKNGVINVLINIMTDNGSGALSQNMSKKAAAYALGQIGDPIALNALRNQYSIERVKGTKEAIGASITAICQAPDGPEHDEFERRKIIQREYNRS